MNKVAHSKSRTTKSRPSDRKAAEPAKRTPFTLSADAQRTPFFLSVDPFRPQPGDYSKRKQSPESIETYNRLLAKVARGRDSLNSFQLREFAGLLKKEADKVKARAQALRRRGQVMEAKERAVEKARKAKRAAGGGR